MASVAAQLARAVPLNAHLLGKKRRIESYLFTGKEVDQYDLDSIHSLAVNGFAQLTLLDPSLSQYQDLVSDASKTQDRTIIGPDEEKRLSELISSCLVALGPYILEAPAAKIIEWLVRRFRINEFNVDDILKAFLPYHETGHFVKMLSILHIKHTSPWSFLLSVKESVKPLHRQTLVTNMLKSIDLTRFVVSLVPLHLEAGKGHRTLFAFNTGVLLEYISRSKALDEGTLAVILPTLLGSLRPVVDRDCILGTFVLLAALSQKCTLTPQAVAAIAGSMLTCASSLETKQTLTALVAVFSAQQEIDALPKSVVADLCTLGNIDTALNDISQWSGSEKLLLALLPVLVSKQQKALYGNVLHGLLNSDKTPAVVIRRAIQLQLKAVASDPSESASGLATLQVVHQRHPNTLGEVAEEISHSIEDEAKRNTFDDLVLGISLASQGGSRDTDLDNILVASAHADPAVRASALKKVYERLGSETGSSPEETGSLAECLISRIYDDELQVLEALYAEPDLLLPLVSERVDEFLKAVELATVGSPEISRKALRLHFSFLMKQFLERNPTSVNTVFERIVFPYLLFTKSKAKTSTTVWEIVAKSPIASLDILKDTAELAAGEGDSAAKNISVAKKVAANIINSKEIEHYIEFLLTLFAGGPEGLLASLVLHTLVLQLKGDRRVDVALKLLKHITKAFIATSKGSCKVTSWEQITSEQQVAKTVFSHSQSESTLLTIRLGLLYTIAQIPRPTGVTLDWMGRLADGVDSRGPQYITLLRECYALSCQIPSVPQSIASGLAVGVLRGTGNDTLAFLAGIWTDAEYPVAVRCFALQHGNAFLVAKSENNVSVFDFQTILPACLVALQDGNAELRAAALSCITFLAGCTRPEGKAPPIYAHGTLYGTHSANLQYLDWQDCSKYLKELKDNRVHISNDPLYLETLHGSSLAVKSGMPSKEKSFRTKIISFIMSHVLCWQSDQPRVQLLESLRGVPNGVKATIVDPLLKNIARGLVSPELTHSLLDVYDHASAVILNDQANKSWDTLVEIAQFAFTESVEGIYSHVETLLVDRLIPVLSFDRRVDLLRLISEASELINDQARLTSVKSVISCLAQDSAITINYLNNVGPSSLTTEPLPKRKRLSQPKDSLHISVTSLQIFFDAINTLTLPGVYDLMAQLLETLRRITNDSNLESAAHKTYLQQTMLDALENCASNVQDTAVFKASTLRLDILTDLIRLSQNPQIFHRCLLLFASIARFAPGAVLHHVMPIFTFMGSDVFHRDDSYSFRVVQKTVESIVPVLVESLGVKEQENGLVDYSASRAFLEVFADSVNHIPKHRKNPFFVHLIHVLPDDVLVPPLILLLLDKCVSRAPKAKKIDTEPIFSLCLTLLTEVKPIAQTRIALALLRECQSLTANARGAEQVPTFLTPTLDSGSSSLASTIAERQAVAILNFLTSAIPASSIVTSAGEDGQPGPTELLQILLSLTLPPDAAETESPVIRPARETLSTAVKHTHVDQFASFIEKMLGTKESLLQLDALLLLAERAPRISAEWRGRLSGLFMRVVKFCLKIINAGGKASQVLPAIDTAYSLLETALEEEYSSFVPISEPLLQLMKCDLDQEKVIARGMALQERLIVKLGPRLLPVFNPTVELATAYLVKTADDPPSSAKLNSAKTLSSLISTLPTFWSKTAVSQVLNYCIRYEKAESKSPIAIALLKGIGPNIVLEASTQCWDDCIQTGLLDDLPKLAAFLHMWRKVLQNTPQDVVVEHLKAVTKVFEDAFRAISRHISDSDKQMEVESYAKSVEASTKALGTSFVELTVKLNEHSFRPQLRKLTDWAFGESAEGIHGNVAVFCSIFTHLVEYFKDLMTPFILVFFDRILEFLSSFKSAPKSQAAASSWMALMKLLEASFNVDDSTFWREDRVQQLLQPLISQVPQAAGSSPELQALQSTINAYAGACPSDDLLKRINLNILMHTRSEEVRVRLGALECAISLWENSPAKERLAGYSMDVANFVAECAEDDHDEVAKAARTLRRSVEAVAGSLGNVLD